MNDNNNRGNNYNTDRRQPTPRIYTEVEVAKIQAEADVAKAKLEADVRVKLAEAHIKAEAEKEARAEEARQKAQEEANASTEEARRREQAQAEDERNQIQAEEMAREDELRHREKSSFWKGVGIILILILFLIVGYLTYYYIIGWETVQDCRGFGCRNTSNVAIQSSSGTNNTFTPPTINPSIPPKSPGDCLDSPGPKYLSVVQNCCKNISNPSIKKVCLSEMWTRVK